MPSFPEELCFHAPPSTTTVPRLAVLSSHISDLVTVPQGWGAYGLRHAVLKGAVKWPNLRDRKAELAVQVMDLLQLVLAPIHMAFIIVA